MSPNTLTNNVPEVVLNRPETAASGEEQILRVLGLEKTYRTGFWRKPKQALAGVSFVVPSGAGITML